MNSADGDPPGLDLARLREYLDAARPGLVHADLSAELIAGGRSNLTYRVTDGHHRWVVRRPPLGHVLPTAHNMAREYRVIAALDPTPVPVPRAVVLCEDTAVLGVPFYVMDEVRGTVYRSAAQTAALGAGRASTIAYALVDVLADLHDLEPASVGLGDFGRPDGYLERQLRRWQAQLEASRSRPLPGMDELLERLRAQMPRGTGRGVIVHGDYRLDNALIDSSDQVAAVLDWEMATLGDPLADVGVMLVYWDWQATMPASGVPDAIHPDTGFPPGADLCERYARRRGVSLDALPWYHAFGYFKIVAILEGVHYRYVTGQTLGPGFDQIGDLVLPLVTLGNRALSRATR